MASELQGHLGIHSSSLPTIPMAGLSVLCLPSIPKMEAVEQSFLSTVYCSCFLKVEKKFLS